MTSHPEIIKIGNAYECVIVERLNRFVVKVSINSTPFLASINNTGRLHEFLRRGTKGYCIRRESPGKTAYRLIAVSDSGKGALIDTSLQMLSFETLISSSRLSWMRNSRIIRRNPRIGSSVLDYLIQRDDRIIHVETKSAVLRINNCASYPDCPSERGRRHIMDLTRLAEQGAGAMLVFISGLYGIDAFIPNTRADPEIGKLLVMAKDAGVEIRAFSIYFDPETASICLDREEIPVVLKNVDGF